MNEPCLDEWKRQYAAIPVPEELESRVRAAILRGKRERRRLRALRRVKNVASVAAAAVLVVAVLANTSQSFARAMEQIPILGAITRVVTFRTYEDERGNVSARVEVPRVEGADEVNASIEEYTEAIIAQYEADAAEIGGKGHYALNLSYDVATDTDAIFALRFRESLVMASGTESVRIYNVEKATGRILPLEALFQPGADFLDVLTREIIRQMEARMAADENAVFWLHEEIDELNFTQLSPDVPFYINGDGELVIVFNEGDVAPMYMGVVEFAIPRDVTRPIANPELLP